MTPARGGERGRGDRGGRGLGLVDGRAVPLDEMSVPVWDFGLRFGLGVFETIRVHEGRALLLRPHAERMARAWKRLCAEWGHASGHDAARLAAWGARAVELSGVRDGALRLIATYGTSGSDGRLYAWAGEERAWPDAVHDAGVRATAVDAPRPPGAPTAGLKALAWADYHLARERARRAGFDEALLRAGRAGPEEEGRGELFIEGCSTSLFAVEGRSLITPPLAAGILPGVTRAFVLARASGLGLEPREGPVNRSLLERCGEAFLTGSLLGIAGLVALDGRPVGQGRPGPAARELHREYLDLARQAHGEGGEDPGRDAL